MNQDIPSLKSSLAALAPGDSRERVDLLIELARAQFMVDLPEATALSRMAYDAAERLAYERGVAYGQYHLGLAAYLRSDHEQAMTTLLAAQQKMAVLDDEHGLGLVRGALAGVHLSVGDYEQAFACSFAALKSHRAVGDRTNEGWLLHGVGGGYHELGDFDRAHQYHSAALRVFEEIELDVGRARALTGLGLVHQARRRFEEALVYHRRSLELFRKVGNDFGESRALNDLGVTRQAMGDFAGARIDLQQALKLREGFGNRQAVSTSLINLGKLALAEDSTTDALDFATRALAIAEQINARPRIYQSHLLLSEIEEARGEPARALEHYKEYERVKEHVAGDQANLRLTNLQVAFEGEKAEREAEISRLKNVELREKNEQLQALLHELGQTQSQMIVSERMAVLGSLVAGLLHEFNTPLGAINGGTDTSRRCLERVRAALAVPNDTDTNTDTDRSAIEQALAILERNQATTRTATERISQIIESLKGFTNIDGAVLESVDINEHLGFTLALLEHRLRGRVELVREFGEVPPLVANPRELSQVFMTLLKNAGEAIEGRGQVTVSTGFAGGEIRIDVRDTGRGMGAERLDQIFEPSLAGTRAKVKSGPGLPAAVKVIRALGGDITAASRLGEGTTFSIRLPLSGEK